MKRLVDLQIFLAVLVVVALLGWGLSAFAGLSYWWAVGLVAGALLLNGVVAEIEDRFPGGFLNPKKKQ